MGLAWARKLAADVLGAVVVVAEVGGEEVGEEENLENCKHNEKLDDD